MENDVVLQVGVKILLRGRDNKFLMIHRSLEKYPDIDGRWDIVGGRINPGVPLLENLQREVKEETNLEIVGQPKLVAAQDILRGKNKHVVRLTYVGRAEGEVVLDHSENDLFQWYTWEEILKIDDLDMYFKEILGMVEKVLRDL